MILSTLQQPSPDHRCLLGLFPSSKVPPLSLKLLISAFKPILTVTVPYISQTWKKYCDLTHQPLPTSTPTLTQSTHSYTPRLTIISGNNGAISTTTVCDHPPSAYTRKRRKHTNTYPHHYTQQLILQNSPLPQSTISLHTSTHPTPSSHTPPSHTQTNDQSAPSTEWSLRPYTQSNTTKHPLHT